MESLLRDIRLGLRSLRKSPGLSLVSVVALTFGIGLTTMMFSIVYGALLRGLPYEDGDRIVLVYRANAENPNNRQSLPIQTSWTIGSSSNRSATSVATRAAR